MPSDAVEKKAAELQRGAQGTSHIAAERGEADLSKEKFGTTAGKGLGAKGTAGKGPMPQQKDYPSVAAWAEALRKWREGGSDPMAAAKALMQGAKK